MIHVIVFSKDRPLQLHGYLTSLFPNWYGDVRVSVLARIEPAYDAAYIELCREFGSRIEMLDEHDFERALSLAVRVETDYICFGTDDAVFTRPVEVAAIERAFEEDDALLGFSLRLGHNVRLGMFGAEQPHPPFLGPRDGGLRWNIDDGGGDWGYPWEVIGTVYRTDFVREMVEALHADSPSRLEHDGAQRWATLTDRRMMRSYVQSRLVVPTVNVVQSVFPNGIVGGGTLSPEFLLDCWNAGLRLDVRRYAHLPTNTWRVGDFWLWRAA